MNFRFPLWLFALFSGLLLAPGCTRHVCPAYHSAFQLGSRDVESFFSYSKIDSVDNSQKLEKNQFGLVIFHFDDSDSAATSGTDSAEVAFKSLGFQSKWKHKRKAPEQLFKPTPKTKYGLAAKKLGIVPKLLKSRRDHIMKYVPAKLKFPETEEDTAQAASDSTGLAGPEKPKFQPNVEQLFYSVHIEPFLPKFDTLQPDTAALDTAQMGSKWWQFWKWKLFNKKDSIGADSIPVAPEPVIDESVEVVIVKDEEEKKGIGAFFKNLFKKKEGKEKTQKPKDRPPKEKKTRKPKPEKPTKEKKPKKEKKKKAKKDDDPPPDKEEDEDEK